MPIYRKNEGQFGEQGLVNRANEEYSARWNAPVDDLEIHHSQESHLMGANPSLERHSIKSLERKARAGQPTPVSGDAMARGRKSSKTTQRQAGEFGSGVIKAGRLVKGDLRESKF